MKRLERLGYAITIVITLVILIACVRNLSNSKINICGFELRVLDDVGKIIAAYNGSEKYGLIVVERDNRKERRLNESNAYVVSNGDKCIVGLTYGSGKYNIRLYEIGNNYEEIFVEQYEVMAKIKDSRAPFIGDGYYVNTDITIEDYYNIEDIEELDVIELIYTFIENNIDYDTHMMELIESGGIKIYKPNLDLVLDKGKGVCIDQASLAASMLRSREIPARIVVGHDYDERYHAWFEVWVDGEWKMYDTTSSITFRDIKSKGYKAIKYY